MQKDSNWQLYLVAHSLAEFMAWLEIFRVQSQTMEVSWRARYRASKERSSCCGVICNWCAACPNPNTRALTCMQ